MPTGHYKRTEYHNAISRKNGFQKGSKVNLGRKMKPTQGFQKGHPNYLTEESIAKLRISSAKIWKGKKRPDISGKNAYQWKGGIYKTGRLKDMASMEYRKWRSGVFKRDGEKCKINNLDCCGQLQAHHILRWADYPELRHDINNGITLCVKHHPRKKGEESRLTPYFRKLIYSIQ